MTVPGHISSKYASVSKPRGLNHQSGKSHKLNLEAQQQQQRQLTESQMSNSPSLIQFDFKKENAISKFI